MLARIPGVLEAYNLLQGKRALAALAGQLRDRANATKVLDATAASNEAYRVTPDINTAVQESIGMLVQSIIEHAPVPRRP